jgi:hypothetical protein
MCGLTSCWSGKGITLSVEWQKAIASRFLAELQDEQKWESRFAAIAYQHIYNAIARHHLRNHRIPMICSR